MIWKLTCKQRYDALETQLVELIAENKEKSTSYEKVSTNMILS